MSFPELWHRKLGDITLWAVEKWRSQKLKSGLAPTTVNRQIATLRSAFSRAVDWGLLSVHPLARLKSLRVDNASIVRYLTIDEEDRLQLALDAHERKLRGDRSSANEWRRERGYAELPDLAMRPFADHLKPMVLLSMHTGVRRGELFSLRWADINFDHATLTVRAQSAKTGKTRHIPLNTNALAVLQAWRPEKCDAADFVFPGKEGQRFDNITSSWQSLLKSAAIKNFRWHDIRHHFASRLVMEGVDLNTVRELLGHSDLKMTLRYAHLGPEHKAQAVAKLLRAA